MIARWIVLHHSATPDGASFSWPAIRKYHVMHNGWLDIGYHFGIELVGKEYEIMFGRLWNEPGAHCKGRNHDGLGVCLVGNFNSVAPSKEQVTVAVRLVSALAGTMGIPVDRIVGHRELWETDCPGKLFDLDAFRHEVEKQLLIGVKHG